MATLLAITDFTHPDGSGIIQQTSVFGLAGHFWAGVHTDLFLKPLALQLSHLMAHQPAFPVSSFADCGPLENTFLVNLLSHVKNHCATPVEQLECH